MRGIAVVLCCTLLIAGASHGEDGHWPPLTERQRLERLIEPLTKAGVDIRNVDALTKEVRMLKGWRSACAALGLALLPPNDAILGELRSATVLGDDLVAVYAAKGLVFLKDREWAAAAAPRLQEFRFRYSRLSFGGYLARSGRYDGWQDVVDTLLDPEANRSEVMNALSGIRDYVLMNDAGGKPVNVCRRLWNLMPQIPQERQESVRVQLLSIQSSSFPKDLNDPRWRQ